jgi:hypothetical protein
MSIPKNLYAFDGRIQDFEWTPIAETPAPQTVQPTPPVAPEPPTPTPPSLPRMKISSKPISYEELAGNLRRYAEELVKVPDWQSLLEEKNKAAKLARREAKQREREARIVERRKAA